MTQETAAVQKPRADENEVLLALSTVLNDISKTKHISQLTMLGVLNALRIEQEHLFWETQLYYRRHNQAQNQLNQRGVPDNRPAAKLKIVRKKK